MDYVISFHYSDTGNKIHVQLYTFIKLPFPHITPTWGDLLYVMYNLTGCDIDVTIHEILQCIGDACVGECVLYMKGIIPKVIPLVIMSAVFMNNM